MGGGFNWIEMLSDILSDSLDGVHIVVHNTNTTLTFVTENHNVRFYGFGDQHESKREKLVHTLSFFANEDGSENDSTYLIYIYPSNEFYSNYETNNPVYASVAAGLILTFCAITFFLYDYYVRGEWEANASVLETKRRFVRFISHEIRTPLNAVHLGLEALIAELRRSIEQFPGSPLESTLSSWLELSSEMTSNCDSAEDVLNDMLNYDKIEMGTLYLEFSSLVIWDVVQTNVAVFHNHIKQKNIHWSVENKLTPCGDDDMESQDTSKFVVVGDSARLAQVMRNLISNALKFTPNDGSIIVRVERIEEHLSQSELTVPADVQHLLEQPRAGSVRISVTDSGAGLSEAQLAKICSEGVQFNANKLQAGKGSGLGLFITKGIVEQHGGKLTVTSGGVGAGTTFAVELPLFAKHQAVEHQRRAAEPRPQEMTSSFDGTSNPVPGRGLFLVNTDIEYPTPTNRLDFDAAFRPPTPRSTPPTTPSGAIKTTSARDDLNIPKRILVVDDASSNRKMLCRILTAKGYVCDQAEDGQQAIDVYRAAVESGQPFYAITMDFEMPVMNGPTATCHLRALGCAIPIIGVTGNMLPDDIKHFKVQGATEFIGKPVNVTRFEDLMQEHGKSIV